MTKFIKVLEELFLHMSLCFQTNKLFPTFWDFLIKINELVTIEVENDI